MALNHRNPEETRARILTAAQESFGALGYDRASVAEICRGAQVTKGAFYHHFESKQAVFMQLLEAWLDDMDQRLAVFEQSPLPVPEQLVAMTTVLGHVLISATEQLPIYLEYLTQALRDPDLRAATIRPYDRFHRRIAEMIRKGIDQGSLKPVPPEATASTLLAMVMGLLLEAMLAPDTIDMSAAAAQSMRVLLAGIIKE